MDTGENKMMGKIPQKLLTAEIDKAKHELSVFVDGTLSDKVLYDNDPSDERIFPEIYYGASGEWLILTREQIYVQNNIGTFIFTKVPIIFRDYLHINKVSRTFRKLCSLRPQGQLCRMRSSSEDGRYPHRVRCAWKRVFSAWMQE